MFQCPLLAVPRHQCYSKTFPPWLHRGEPHAAFSMHTPALYVWPLYPPRLCHSRAQGVSRMRALLDCGANPNIPDHMGQAPIHKLLLQVIK